MKQKIICFIGCILLLSSILVFSSTAEETKAPVTLAEATAVDGEALTYDVPFSIDLSGARGVDLNIRLNPDLVDTAEMIDPAESISNAMIEHNQSDDKFKIAIANAKDIDNSGRLFTLRVKLKTDAAPDDEICKLLQIKVNEEIVWQASDRILLVGVADGKTYDEPITISFNEGTATLNGESFAKGGRVDINGVYTLTVTDTGGKTRTVRFTYDDTPDDTETEETTPSEGEDTTPAPHEHVWSAWTPNNDGATHSRYCSCNATETKSHGFDGGRVTTSATHTSKGVRTYTCEDCSYYYVEDIPTTPDHEWSDWSPNENGTHTRTCGCKATETKDCEWDDGVMTEPTCEEDGSTVYTCTVCDNTKTETEPALDHDWNDWGDSGEDAEEDAHERTCKREGCEAKESEEHKWGDWISAGSEKHQKTCSVCDGVRAVAHTMDDGVETKQPTVTKTGEKTYTCTECEATKKEVIPKIVCDHSWDDWSADDGVTHTRTCVNGNDCIAFQKQEHEWDEGKVTTEPTETSEGVRTYTCSVCGYEKTEAVEMLQHTHRFGEWTSNGEKGHIRRCENGESCTVTETAEHTCDAWSDDGDGAHTGKCSVCDAEMTEAHTMSEWKAGDDDSKYVRDCKCGAAEEMTVQKPISDVVINSTKAEDNDANAELVVEKADELFNNVLNEEERSAVAGGNTTVSVYLEVSDIPEDQVSSSDKAAAEEVVEKNDNSLNEKTEIGMFLDINLFKEVTTTDEATAKTVSEETKITETTGKVTISIQIPDALINTDSAVERVYRIIRVHEDINGALVTDVIEGDFDPETKMFTFESDKFSTYVLAYNDEDVKYTVTYTDGVEDAEIFADQQYTVNEGGDTPAFVGTPVRDGYTFDGWTPVVSNTVTGDVTYTALWTEDETPPEEHEHDFDVDWSSDETNHWKECSCGEKSELDAHTLDPATCEAKAKCIVCQAEFGELAEHDYSEATCTAKAKCSVCGNETGELLAHDYSEATCTAKAKCSVCGDETGELLAHDYSEATCIAKAKCSVCGVEKGELADHTDTDDNEKCDTCGADMPKESPNSPLIWILISAIGVALIAGVAVALVMIKKKKGDA